MQNFEFYCPTKVVFGKETQSACGRLVKEFGGKKVLLHYGSASAEKSGLLEQIRASLREAEIPFIELGGVVPNPRLSLVHRGIELALREQADFLLAVGGGSVIDSAKAIAVGAFHRGEEVWDFYSGKKTPRGALPLGCVLTIAAAGSETSQSSVITNEETGEKRGMNTDLYRPRFAVMNPELTYTLPAYQTAAGVVDIMMHTMERYFTPAQGNDLTDEIAEDIIHSAVKYGPRALDYPNDYEARSELMWAGSLSHNTLTGLGRPSDFSVHQLGHELSAKFDATHGATLSALWGSWARAVYHTDLTRFARFARKGWNINTADFEQAAESAIATTEDFFHTMRMPASIPELLGRQLSEEELVQLADRCSRGGTRKIGVFCPMDREGMLKIYREANTI
ncbi:iron-containing alcohol dehydrogenase [Acidaminobacterium chupaoyuni]